MNSNQDLRRCLGARPNCIYSAPKCSSLAPKDRVLVTCLRHLVLVSFELIGAWSTALTFGRKRPIRIKRNMA